METPFLGGSEAEGAEAERRKLLQALRPHLGVGLLDDDPVLSTRDVALLFRVSAATVRRWADAGKIEARRSLGGRWTFPVAGIRRTLQRVSAGWEPERSLPIP